VRVQQVCKKDMESQMVPQLLSLGEVGTQNLSRNIIWLQALRTPGTLVHCCWVLLAHYSSLLPPGTL